VTCPGAVVGVAVPLAARSRSTGLCLARLVAHRPLRMIVLFVVLFQNQTVKSNTFEECTYSII